MSECPKAGTTDCGQDHPGCTAHNHLGGPCGSPPMLGTDPKRCFLHVGRKTSVVKAEHQAQLRAEKIRSNYKVSEHGDPLTELLHLADEIVKWKNCCRELVGQLTVTEFRYRSAGAGEQVRAEIRLYEASLDRAAKVLSDLTRLNIEDRLVKVGAAQTALVAGAIEGAMAELAPLLGYDPAQPEIRFTVAKHLRMIEAEKATTL